METIFSAPRYRLLDLAKDLVITVILFLLVFVATGYLLPDWHPSISWSILMGLFLSQLFASADKHRLHELVFDPANRRIRISYRSMITGTHHKIVSFDDASLEVSMPRWKIGQAGSPALYILKRNKEVFTIEKTKDKIDGNTIQQIVQTMDLHSIPVKQI